MGNDEPEETSDVREGVPRSSLAVGAVQVTTAVAVPESVFWVVDEGQPVMVGGVSSIGEKEGGVLTHTPAEVQI